MGHPGRNAFPVSLHLSMEPPWGLCWRIRREIDIALEDGYRGSGAVVFFAGLSGLLSRTEAIVIELHGEENRRLFASVMAEQPFASRGTSELTVCKRLP